MQGCERGSDVPKKELLGLLQVPLGNSSAGAIRALFLSDRGHALDVGSGSFYPETNFSQGAEIAIEVLASGIGARPINR